ncbi:MAG TPA: hypothetical protein VKT32_00545 [Chthonomonadaceae bacterium]|nr:hypothetical protein [Chthonomonadaceae bacterium]
MVAVHTSSVRIAEDIYREAEQIARRRNISFNALVQEALKKEIEAAQDREMYEAATLLGQDAEMCDVDYAFAAQAEVALSNEPSF